MKSILKGRHSKGQAAMEFLMTYGWAILAAIIAIGVLAYFGVFNPGRLAGPVGVLNAPFVMDNFNMNASDYINMEITHNLGESITLDSAGGIGVELTGSNSGTCNVTQLSPSTAYLSGTNPWPSGTQILVAADCPADWSDGDQVSAEVTITYTVGSSSLSQTSTGNVRGVSQA